MLNLTVTCYPVLCYPWDACSFLEGNREGVDRGEGKYEETGRRGGKGYCSLILCVREELLKMHSAVHER